MDNRIKQTYVKDSKATLQTKLYDAYVRFFRWATDRLGDRDGVICFVTNNSFIDQIAFDGMRKHLLNDFTQVYYLDLHGNVRKNPKLSGTTHNVFGIQIGAGITVAVRRAGTERFLKYHRVPENWRKTEKLAWLTDKKSVSGVEWQTLQPDAKQAWLTDGLKADFENFLPIASKEAKASKSANMQTIFKAYSLGVSTNRDGVVYDYSEPALEKRMVQAITAGRPTDVDNFVSYTDVKWSEHLKNGLKRAQLAEFHKSQIRRTLYRPYASQHLYYDSLFNDRPSGFGEMFPTPQLEQDNQVICLSNVGNNKPFQCLATNSIADLHLTGDTQCFPLYTYALDGKIRRDNITDWALGQFRDAYRPDVTNRDIFHYVYALLHHQTYRERYRENLKRELPRVPLVAPLPARLGSPPSPSEGRGLEEDAVSGSLPPSEERAGEGEGLRMRGAAADTFRAFADTGAALAALHVGYEQADEYPLTQIVSKDVTFSWRVTKMRLNADKTAVTVNESLTLAGIPPEAFAYRLGNRSALEWVLDQYQVTTDKRSGLVSDPNRADQPGYIAHLVRRVVTVSVETVKLVNSLPPLDLPDPAGGRSVFQEEADVGDDDIAA